MKPHRPRASFPPKLAAAALAGLLLAGCGEVGNTIKPPPDSANQITVALAGQPNAFYAGIYEAQALGIFKQSDLDVHLVIPSATEDPVSMVHENQVIAAISSEPNVLLHRNEDQPVVGVAAILQAPLQTVTIKLPRGGPSGGGGLSTATTTVPSTRSTTTVPSTRSTTRTRRRRKRRGTTTRTTRTVTTTPATTTTPTTTTPTTTTLSDPGAPLWPANLQQLLGQPGYPTYDGLVIVVRKETIVNDAPLLRRFVQAVARGYRAARANPAQAIDNLIAAVPALAPQRTLEAATLTSALPEIFPAGLKVWGFQQQAQWNAFGNWLSQHQLLANANAITDASTNELLAGQGV